ncbi:MAG: TonB-dependent receptor [bacterium]
MPRTLLLLSAGLLAWGGKTASAQQPPLPEYIMDPVVVTATRTPTPASRTGAGVEVITGAELQARGAATVFEALQGLPGLVTVRAGAAGGTGSVYLRGAKAEHLLVLVDGAEVNDPLSPAGSFDWTSLTTDAVERVEVVKGPQSTLYGSDAMAGVVNIITRAPAVSPESHIALEAGGYETLNARAGLSGRLAGIGCRLELSRSQMGGISTAGSGYGNEEADAWGLWAGVLSLSREVGEGSLSATLRGARSRTDLDDFGGPGGDDPNSLGWKADLAGTLRWRAPLGEGGEHRLTLAGSRTHRWNRDGPDPRAPDEDIRADYRGRIHSLEWQHTLERGNHLLTGGAAAERESGSSWYCSSSGGLLYEEELGEQEQWSRALYLQDQVRLGSADITAGLRADHFTDYGTRPTFRAAVTMPAGPLRLRAAAATGFKAPSLYQRSSGLYGNPELGAERTVGYEAGLSAPISDRGRARIGWFRQEIRDLIDFVYDPATSTSVYRNRGRVDLMGWEGSLHLALTGRLGLETSLTLLRTGDGEGVPLLRRPEGSGAAGFRYRDTAGRSAALRLHHVGERRDLDFSVYPAVPVVLDAVTLLEGEVLLPLTPSVDVRLRGENLTDTEPEWVWGYGSRGRTIYAGVIVRP